MIGNDSAVERRSHPFVVLTSSLAPLTFKAQYVQAILVSI